MSASKLHPFKVGDKTFIVEINPATDLPKVYEREVIRVSAKQLEIVGPTGRVIHRPTTHLTETRWSPIVFATPEVALEMYAAQRFDEIERAERRKLRAKQLRTHTLALLHEYQLGARRSPIACEFTDDGPDNMCELIDIQRVSACSNCVERFAKEGHL